MMDRIKRISRLSRFIAIALFATLLGSAASFANVTLPAIFGDHMVLQRGMKIPIWGSAEPGETVTVKAAGQSKSAQADDHGAWRITLEPISATQPIELSVAGKNAVVFKDVLVGEVWLCSGQSNMGFALKNASTADAALKAADRPTMRLFTVEKVYKDQPQRELGGKWEICSPQTAPDFSAVGYFFGQALQQKLNAPVGLIDASWGGTRAEAWIDRPTFDRLNLPYEPQWTELWLHPKQHPNSSRPPKQRPYEAPAVIYNGMIAPMAGYAMRGVAWYQGETNTAYPAKYHDVLTALIQNWRRAWNQGDFTFLIVQLPNFDSGTRDWPTLRASQAQVARQQPNTGLAVTIDIGETKTIHPTNKQTVGQRLARLAEKLAYGQDVVDSGPTFKSMRIDGPRAIVSFDHAGGGLKAKGDALEGFEIAGADGKFIPAAAKIDGDTVIVSADSIASPVAVRYGWENDPKCTLYNDADLPAAPFEARAR
jgi:sialate O-acetylesterase